MVELTWLIFVTAGLACWAWWDAREYRSFHTVTETGIRQHYLKLWTLQSFVFFTGASVATLAIVGHTAVPIGLPAEFAPLADMVSSTREAPTESPASQLGLIMGIAVGVSAAALIQWYRAKKLLTPVVGDIEALNGRQLSAYSIFWMIGRNVVVSGQAVFRAETVKTDFQGDSHDNERYRQLIGHSHAINRT